MIIPKVENPIKIRIGKGQARLMFSDGTEQDLLRTNGCMFVEGSEHYGIHILRDIDGTNIPETTYFTQCEVATVEFDTKTNTLKVSEYNKYPGCWKFDKDGDLNERATFSEIWRPDMDYVAKHIREIVDWAKQPANQELVRPLLQEPSSGDDLVRHLLSVARGEDQIKTFIKIANVANNIQMDKGKITSIPPRSKNNSDGGKA